MQISGWTLAKWAGWVLAGALLLTIAAILIVTSVIDPNRYRGRVEAAVSEFAGRPFRIDGNLRLTWYPWLGVRVGAAHLENPRGTPGPPLVSWESMSVAAKLVPLLKGQWVIDRVRLQSPRVRLHRDSQGHGNWEGLGSRGVQGQSAPASRQSNQPLQIGGIEIRDGAVDYRDEKDESHWSLSGWDLDLGAWHEGGELPVHSRFRVRGGSLPESGVDIGIDTASATVSVAPLAVSASALALQVANARIKGSLMLRQTRGAESQDHIEANGSAAVSVPSVRKLAADLALDNSLPRDPTTLGRLELTGTWSLNDGALVSRPVTLMLDGTTFNGWIERSAPPQSMWSFEFRGDRIDLRRYTDIETKVPKPFDILGILRSLRANGSVTFEQAQLADADMKDVRLRFQTSDAKR